MAATVADVIAILESAWPPELAEDWDAVGLSVGAPGSQVTTALLAIDPIMEVVEQATAIGAQMIVTHHPLLLHGVHSVAADTTKGRVIHACIERGISLFCAHTNADHGRNGVSDELARILGVSDTRPMVALGDFPAYGTGRIGRLSMPTTLQDFADRVAQVLPATSHGIRVAGDLQAPVQVVAVCGGAGDAFLSQAQVADVYVTSDLRHHRAQDHLQQSRCALVDIPHWSGEWPWLANVASVLNDTVTTVISQIPTDPWAAHVAQQRGSRP